MNPISKRMYVIIFDLKFGLPVKPYNHIDRWMVASLVNASVSSTIKEL